MSWFDIIMVWCIYGIPAVLIAGFFVRILTEIELRRKQDVP